MQKRAIHQQYNQCSVCLPTPLCSKLVSHSTSVYGRNNIFTSSLCVLRFILT